MRKIKQGIALILCLTVLAVQIPAISLAEEAAEKTFDGRKYYGEKTGAKTATGHEDKFKDDITGTTEDGYSWVLWDDPLPAADGEETSAARKVIWITDYTGTEGKITTPATIEGYPVTGIYGEAFYHNEIITDVVLSEGITYIGLFAFADCPNLESLSIPSTLNCWAHLVDADRKYYLQYTTQGSDILPFIQAPKLKNLTFAEGIKTIVGGGSRLFPGISPNPNVATSPDNYLSMETLKIPASVEDISRAFQRAPLQEVEIPADSKMTTVGAMAFAESAITRMILPDSVETIEKQAFQNCRSLEYIILGKGIKTIENYNFNISTTILMTNPDITDISGLGNGIYYTGCTIYCPPGSTTEQTLRETQEKRAEANPWNLYTYIVADDMTAHPGEHIYETVVTKEPTCEEPGIETSRCRICYTVEEEKEIPATGHQYEVTKSVPATTEAEGYTLKTCKVCDKQIKDGITPKLKTITSTEKPVVGRVTLKKILSPKKRTIKVQWKKVNGVTGYEIRLGTNKKMTKNKKVIKVKKAATVKKTIKKLKGGKKYFVKIRAYTEYKDGNETKTVYGAWSKPQKVKVKK